MAATYPCPAQILFFNTIIYNIYIIYIYICVYIFSLSLPLSLSLTHTHFVKNRHKTGLGENGSNPSTHWQMLYMLLAGSEMPAARWGNESATGNEYVGHYIMEDQDLPDGL